MTWAPVGQTPVAPTTGARYRWSVRPVVNVCGDLRFMLTGKQQLQQPVPGRGRSVQRSPAKIRAFRQMWGQWLNRPS